MSRSFENPATADFGSQSDFQKLTQLISTNIQKITTNVTQMQNLQSQIAAKPNHLELQDRFHRIQHQTNILAKDTSKNIKELSDCTPSNTSDQKLHKIRKERLLNDFTRVLNTFQHLQRQEKSIESTEHDKITSNSQSSQDPFEAPDTEQIQTQDQAVLQVEGTQEDLDLMQKREQAVRQLETDISDVNNIFKELALLVHDQGNVIESIEANTESAAVQVEQGTEELRVARNYSTKTRKRKFCLIGTLIVIVVIICIVLAIVYR